MAGKRQTKVAIISNNALRYSPYISFYSYLLEEDNVEYIILNKEDDDSVDDEQHHSFKQTSDVLSKGKLKRTISWYKFLHKEFKQNNVDKIIVTPTRTAIVLFPILLLCKRKYIFDIRDFTRENSFLYRIMEKCLLSRAGLVVISSAGFKKWLPKTRTKVLCVHNMPYNVNSTLSDDMRSHSDEKHPTVIGYVGLISYAAQNIALIKAFANDKKYSLQYSGQIDPSSSIIRYVNDNKITNVSFTGRFQNEMKPTIYKQISMINAVYGNDSMIVTTALPNKLYDALIYRIPIIASKGTYLGDIVSKYGIGLTIDTQVDDIHRIITEYWNRYDRNQFEANCEALYKMIELEQQNTIEQIKLFLYN